MEYHAGQHRHSGDEHRNLTPHFAPTGRHARALSRSRLLLRPRGLHNVKTIGALTACGEQQPPRCLCAPLFPEASHQRGGRPIMSVVAAVFVAIKHGVVRRSMFISVFHHRPKKSGDGSGVTCSASPSVGDGLQDRNHCRIAGGEAPYTRMSVESGRGNALTHSFYYRPGVCF